MSNIPAIVSAANSLTWPGAFAVVGIAVAVAAVVIVALWAVTR